MASSEGVRGKGPSSEGVGPWEFDHDPVSMWATQIEPVSFCVLFGGKCGHKGGGTDMGGLGNERVRVHDVKFPKNQ